MENVHNALTQCQQMTSYGDIELINGLLSDGNMPLPDPMLTYQQ